MPTSQTDIVNFALFLIGEQKLNNPVSKTTKTGRLALTVFNQCRDEMLALPVEWVYFRTRAELGAVTAPTIGTYDFAYALPDNHIRTIATIDVDGDEVVYAYRREVQGTTQVILSNESPAYISYIVRLTDTAKWPPWFTRMVYTSIAFLLSSPLKQRDDQTINMFTLLRAAIKDGIAANQKENMDVSDSNQDLDLGNDDVSKAATLSFARASRRIVQRGT